MRRKWILSHLVLALVAASAGTILGVSVGRRIPAADACHWPAFDCAAARPIGSSCDRARAAVKPLLEAIYLRKEGELPVFDTDTPDLVLTHWTHSNWTSSLTKQRWKSHFAPVGRGRCSFHIQHQFSGGDFIYDSVLQEDVFKTLEPYEAGEARCKHYGCEKHDGD